MGKDTKEAAKEAPKGGALWIYKGKYPTRAGGRLVYPGNTIRADKKPGPQWHKVKK